MENLGTILVLLAFISFSLGLLGVLKGSVKLLKISSRKTSGLLLVGSLIVFIAGGLMLPMDTSTAVPAKDTEISSKAEEKKEIAKEAEKNEMETAEKEGKETAVVPVTTPKKEKLNRELEVHFVDVGQGAAQVIIAPNNKVMVVDGGNNDDEDDMVAYLKELGVSKVDVLIGTHPDADHIGGIDAVIDAFDIGKIYMPKVQRDTQTFEDVLLSIQNKGLKVTTAKAGIELDLDPTMDIKMISPIDETDSDANELSAVVRIQYGEQSFLLTGDIGVPAEEKLIQSGENLQSTVLLVGHHGSGGSSSEAFIEAVQPKDAVIQVGKNSYGHPTADVLDRFSEHNVNIYRNDTDGTIVFKTNGEEIEVNKNAWVSTTVAKENTQMESKEQTPMTTASSAGSVNGLEASAMIDNANPNQNEEVTVIVTVKDGNGKPVSGANVNLKLEFKSKDTPYEAVTNTDGVASLSFKIGRAAAGFTVNGDITVSIEGTTTTAQTSFTPQ